MRKLILVTGLALALAGCQTAAQVLDDIGNVTRLATVGVANPVTKQDLYNFENTMIVGFAALNAYKKACLKGAVDTNCRANIVAMQKYTRQIPPTLAQVRTFVKNNDTVNATTAYATLKNLYANFKAIAVANNLGVQ